MPDTSSNDAKQPTEPSDNNLSKACAEKLMKQPSVYSDKSSTPPKLSDMPFDVVGLIIERSDYKEQLILRKTSKSLRELVDKQKPSCKRLSVSCKFNGIICYYNDHCVAYIPRALCCIYTREMFMSENKNYRFDTFIRKTDHEQLAFADLAFTLKNPKLQLELFSFDSECDGCLGEEFDDFVDVDDINDEYQTKYEKMQSVLGSIKHQLSVKECKIDISRFSNSMSILPYLKPGVLEKITIWCDHSSEEWGEDSKTMNRFGRLDQWKQAKELGAKRGFDEEFPVKHVTHFKRFQFDQWFLEPDTLVRIRNFLLNKTNFQFCSILGEYENVDDFQSVVGTKVTPNLSHFSIPNSDDYLEFKITENLITIEKKKK